MSFLADVLAWFADPVNWSGSGGIPNRVFEHVQLSTFAMMIAALLGIIPAVILGHARRGGVLAVAAVNIARAVPSFAIIALALPVSIALGLGLGFWPTLLALVALAIPPMFTNAYTAVRDVDPGVVEAARGMGMTPAGILAKVEVPMALPIILAAVRVSAVQVVATATLGAIVAWGGLGRYVIDGFATRNNVEVFAGGLLVALLAVATEVGFGVLERLVEPRGLRMLRGQEQVVRPAPT